MTDRTSRPATCAPIAGQRAMPRTPDAAQPESPGSITSERLLRVRDAAKVLRLSESWLAKARMRGDGPPFLKIGRSVRYAEGTLREWLHGQTRRSTIQREGRFAPTRKSHTAGQMHNDE